MAISGATRLTTSSGSRRLLDDLGHGEVMAEAVADASLDGGVLGGVGGTKLGGPKERGPARTQSEHERRGIPAA
jgi:hypothetical protein